MSTTMLALTDSRKAVQLRSTEHDVAGTGGTSPEQPESGTRIVDADCTGTAREKFLAPARASSRFDERPAPTFAAIAAPAGACAIVTKAGEVLAVFFRAGYSMFDARDVQKARTADLAVVSCETGGALYHFRSKKRREVAL